MLIVANKWDLIEKRPIHIWNMSRLSNNAPHHLLIFRLFSPQWFKSKRIFKVLEAANEVYENRQRRISTSVLNDVLLPIIQASPPPAASRGRYIKIKYITQLKTAAPQFVFFCNFPKEVKESYRRF